MQPVFKLFLKRMDTYGIIFPTGFEGNFCNASQPCALDPQGCELVQCDCPSRSNSRCQGNAKLKSP